MKKFFEGIRNKVNGLCVKAQSKMEAVKANLADASGEGYIDTAVKIIIGVVVGAVILGGLYALFKTVILPRLNTEITGMFNYKG